MDRQHDALAVGVQSAYYGAYWNNAKHPMSLKRVIKGIYADEDIAPKPDVNVDKYLERKRRFQDAGLIKHNK